MRKFAWALLICLALSVSFPAAAEEYTFSTINAKLSLPNGVYSQVITASNYESKEAFLTSQGLTLDEAKLSFEAEGALLMAFDTENNRRFVLTALQDVDAETYFDLNNQDNDMRKEFRTSHTDGSAYSALGYRYTSAAWKKYGANVDRFLQTKYSLRQNGELVCNGCQRRTIRNGYTITLDMQVYGRSLKDTDVSALETIMKTFVFTRILEMPPLPIKLILTAEPPEETNEATFTIKGTSQKKAAISVIAISASGAENQVYSATAGSNGAFSIKVKLPAKGVYTLMITASAEGANDASRNYSVSYDPTILPVTITDSVPTTLSDETLLAGTAISGAKIQVSVTGPTEIHKTDSGKTFSFKLDTSAEGTYTFNLTIAKSGLSERTFTFTGTRTLTAEERRERIRQDAIKPAYSKLTANMTSYDGRTFGYTAYLVETEESAGEWIYTMALTKSGDSYREVFYVTAEQPVAFQVGDQVKVYATKAGEMMKIVDGTATYTPRFDLLFMESL